MFFKISNFYCIYRMPFLSGRTMRYNAFAFSKKAVLNKLYGQRYRNEMLAVVTMKSRVQIAQWSANKHFDSQLTFSPKPFSKLHENTENNLWKQYLATYGGKQCLVKQWKEWESSCLLSHRSRVHRYKQKCKLTIESSNSWQLSELSHRTAFGKVQLNDLLDLLTQTIT